MNDKEYYKKLYEEFSILEHNKTDSEDYKPMKNVGLPFVNCDDGDSIKFKKIIEALLNHSEYLNTNQKFEINKWKHLLN